MSPGPTRRLSPPCRVPVRLGPAPSRVRSVGFGRTERAAGDDRAAAVQDVVGLGGPLVDERAGLGTIAVQHRHDRFATVDVDALQRLIHGALDDAVLEHPGDVGGRDERRRHRDGGSGGSSRRGGLGRSGEHERENGQHRRHSPIAGDPRGAVSAAGGPPPALWSPRRGGSSRSARQCCSTSHIAPTLRAHMRPLATSACSIAVTRSTSSPAR